MSVTDSPSSSHDPTSPLRAGVVSVVVPCYRSAATLSELCDRLEKMFSQWGREYEIILINDASPDDTWKSICELAAGNEQITGLNLARNFGQQSAVLCGFHHAIGEFVVTLDDDLQHEPEAIPTLFDELIENDLDCVIARLISPQHGQFRGLGTQLVRRFTSFVFGLRNELYFSSFRVLRGRVAKQVLQFRNSTPVIGFLILLATTRVANTPIDHAARARGSSNYSLRHLFAYFSDMVTGYSVLPLQASGWLGFALLVSGLMLGIILGIAWCLSGEISYVGVIAVSTLLLCSPPFLCLGILSPYVRRLVSEPSDYPKFLIRETTDSHRGGV